MYKEYDTWDNTLRGLPYGLYLYAIDNNILIANNKDSLITQTNASISLIYNPFIKLQLLNYDTIPFDTKRFGNVVEGNYIPLCRRIKGGDKIEYAIGSIRKYDNNEVDFSKRKIANESILQNYPYKKYAIYDYINPPLELEPQYLGNNINNPIMVRTSISDKCTYSIYVKDYLGDFTGTTQALVNTGILDLPISSSAYSSLISRTKAQMIASNTSNLANLELTKKSNNLELQANNLNYRKGIYNNNLNGLTSLGSMFTGNIVGGAIGALGSRVNNNFLGQESSLNSSRVSLNNQLAKNNYATSVNMQLAQLKDSKNTPRTMINIGNDLEFSLTQGDFSVDLITYKANDYYLERIANYYHYYGYKQNKFMEVNLCSRKKFTYIKTVECNIKGNLNNQIKECIKDIFNNGVRLWNLKGDNFYNEVLDFDGDNTELSLL